MLIFSTQLCDFTSLGLQDSTDNSYEHDIIRHRTVVTKDLGDVDEPSWARQMVLD